MKKILYSLICMTLIIVGCEKEPIIIDGKVPTGPFPTVAIAFSGIGDSTFVATLTPGEGTGFYSYYVAAGESEVLDSLVLFTVGYSGIIEGTTDYSKNSTTVITLKKLAPSKKYQVYAVAADTDGVPGVVANAEVVTTNVKTPFDKLKGFSASGTTATLTFNQSVKRGAETAKAYATYYAINRLTPETALKTVTIHKDSIKVSGASATITLEKPANGVYAIITWDEGLVLNLVGKKFPASHEDKFDSKDPSKSKGNILRVPVKAFAVKYPMIKKAGTNKYVRMSKDTIRYIPHQDWNTSSVVSFISDSVLIKQSEEAKVFEEYTLNTKINSSTEKFPLVEFNRALSFDADTVITCKLVSDGYPETISNLIFEEGAFEDVYGNKSAKFSTNGNYVSSYNYEFTDIVGTYSIAGVMTNKRDTTETGIRIARLEGKDSVTVTNLFRTGSTAVKGAFDKHKGEITISSGQKLGKHRVAIKEDEAEKVQEVILNGTIVLDFPYSGLNQKVNTSTTWGYQVPKGGEVTAAVSLFSYEKTEWTK